MSRYQLNRHKHQKLKQGVDDCTPITAGAIKNTKPGKDRSGSEGDSGRGGGRVAIHKATGVSRVMPVMPATCTQVAIANNATTTTTLEGTTHRPWPAGLNHHSTNSPLASRGGAASCHRESPPAAGLAHTGRRRHATLGLFELKPDNREHTSTHPPAAAADHAGVVSTGCIVLVAC